MSEDTHEIRPDVECDAFQKALAYIQERADTTGNKKMIAAAEALEAAAQCAIMDKDRVDQLRAELVSCKASRDVILGQLRDAQQAVSDLKLQVADLDQSKKAEADAIVAMRIAQTEAATMRECMDKVFPTPFGAALHPIEPDTLSII